MGPNPLTNARLFETYNVSVRQPLWELLRDLFHNAGFTVTGANTSDGYFLELSIGRAAVRRYAGLPVPRAFDPHFTGGILSWTREGPQIVTMRRGRFQEQGAWAWESSWVEEVMRAVRRVCLS